MKGTGNHNPQGLANFTHIILRIKLLAARFFETGSHYAAPAGLELTVQTRMVSNSQRFFPYLSSAGIKGKRHHTQFVFNLKTLLNEKRATGVTRRHLQE